MNQGVLSSPGDLLRGVERLTWSRKKRGPAPVEKWEPPFCGDIDMRIARDGVWYYMGSPIGRIAMVQMFASVLRRDADGRYYLVTPHEKVGVKVDDAPFVAIEMKVEGNGREQILSFRTNVDDWVTCDAEHRLRFEVSAEGGLTPYLHVRADLWAKVTRALYYDLVDMGEERVVDGRSMFGIASGGAFFAMADAEQMREAH